MPKVSSERQTVELDDNFVVLLIGMRINKWWKIHKWLPVALAMLRMLYELGRNREVGCLHTIFGARVIVQYWKSFEHLEKYAQSRDHQHLPAWRAFNKRVGQARGDVGVWHETYRIRLGEFEAIYSGMPPFGLGNVGRLVPATGSRENARGRLTADR